MLLNNEWVNNKIKEKNQKIPWDEWTGKYDPNSMRQSQSSSKEEIYSNIGLIQETRKNSNNLTLLLNELGKEQAKPKVRKEEIIKIRVEIIWDLKQTN